MRFSIKTKIISILLAALFATVAVSAGISVYTGQSRARHNLSIYASTVLSRIIDMIVFAGMETQTIQPYLVSAGTDPKIKNIIVVDNDFVIKGTSEFGGIGSLSPELQNYGYVAGTQRRFKKDRKNGHPLLEVVSPVITPEGRTGTAFLEIDMADDFDQAVNMAVKVAFVMFLMFLGLIGFIYFFIQRGLVRHILHLKKKAILFAGGALDERVIVQSRDEIGELGSAFNKMAEDLRAAMENEKEKAVELASLNQQLTANEQQLKALNQQLRANEQQLRAANQQLKAAGDAEKKARGELTEKVTALERFQKVTVGRELEMVELKKRIKEHGSDADLQH
jgi:methyl-accepting chemotaxis protein